MNGANFYRYASVFLICFIVSNGLIPANGQIATGGSYALEQAAIANGGGRSTDAVNDLYKVSGITGQSAAGASMTGSPYNVKSGFWNAPSLAPTAANVSISGRVVREDGMGITNVLVSLEGGGLTTPRVALTSTFGYFTLDDIESGHTYLISVSSKKYGFGQPSLTISVIDNVTDILFQASWQY